MKYVKMITKYAGPSGTCAPGKTISVEDNEAEALVEGRYAEYVDQPAEIQEKFNESDLPEGLIQHGGGWYELPNGEKVQGKEEALLALGQLAGGGGGK